MSTSRYYHWFYTLLDILLLFLMNPGVVKHHQRSCKICHFYSKHYGGKLHHPVTKITIYVIKIIWLLLLIIFIIVIIIITIINITQFKIPNSVIHWCQATTGCLKKPNKILSFLHISSTFLSIVAELIGANFWMRLIDLFTLACFKLPFSHNGSLLNATTTTGYNSRLTANIFILFSFSLLSLLWLLLSLLLF